MDAKTGDISTDPPDARRRQSATIEESHIALKAHRTPTPSFQVMSRVVRVAHTR